MNLKEYYSKKNDNMNNINLQINLVCLKFYVILVYVKGKNINEFMCIYG